MTTTARTTTTLTARSVGPHHTLTAARIMAGLLGVSGLAGMTYFLLIAPDSAVWLGPWIDVPVVAVMLTGFVLKLGFAVIPGLSAHRRLLMGFLAVGIAMAVTLVKIPLYDEPEGVLILGIDAVLLGILLLARRSTTSTR